MMVHRTARRHLYEYMEHSLEAQLHRAVEIHLQRCPRCTAELKDLEETAGMIQRSPGDTLPDEYWDSLIEGAVNRIREREYHSGATLNSPPRRIHSVGLFRRPALSLALGATVCVVAAFFIMRAARTPEQYHLATVQNVHDDTNSGIEARTDRYLRRSQALLVGLVNMKASDNQTVDLTVEKEVSRSLIREARFLKNAQLDPASARIVYDIEPILVELANAQPAEGQPAVHLIRDGIFERNLLFKVRMAGLMRDSTRFAAHFQ